MITQRFSCILKETYWFVTTQYHIDQIGFWATEERLRTTDFHEALELQQKLPGSTLTYIDALFLDRCVTCGYSPYERTRYFKSWDDLVVVLQGYPGWCTTSEQLVFCPYDRPSKEE
ncbi:hypothetical protein [Amycolatopsis sp. H20-H5]|uniref:hypothetical protein n=1 Tax=Amycolatopsis sp. H20-H5 TaxID=3046309 RepID=UPI002DBF0D3D|nr:hypothetical protein [Amycolatopsis sp. H20-H5]MEC3975939.1 hypothetical protein [Amycolatopsis sp. H20-H5]